MHGMTVPNKYWYWYTCNINMQYYRGLHEARAVV